MMKKGKLHVDQTQKTNNVVTTSLADDNMPAKQSETQGDRPGKGRGGEGSEGDYSVRRPALERVGKARDNCGTSDFQGHAAETINANEHDPVRSHK